MAEKIVKAVPEGLEGVMAHLVVDGCAEAIEFYKKAFGAEELERSPAPDGKRLIHAEVRIGGSVVYLVDDFPEYAGGQSRHPRALGGTPVTLHQYVEDIDGSMERAVKAGATMKMPAMDMFWGDRYGIVTDPFGHDWSFATHIADPTKEEMEAAAAAMFAGGSCDE